MNIRLDAYLGGAGDADDHLPGAALNGIPPRFMIKNSILKQGVYNMRIYVGFDDTDTIDAERGTGKLARWFEQAIPEGGRLWGVVRQQLLLDPGIPYTSHNSSACAVIDCDDRAMMIDLLIEKAIAWRREI